MTRLLFLLLLLPSASSSPLPSPPHQPSAPSPASPPPKPPPLPSPSSSPVAPAPHTTPAPFSSPPASSPSPPPAPRAAPPLGSTNGTLDPLQVDALSLLGVSVGPDPCNTASQHVFVCDEGTPYRHLLSLLLEYCTDSAVYPASAWANLTSLRSLSFSECPAKLMQLPAELLDSLTSLSVVASLGRSVENVLAPGLPGTWLSKFHNLVELTVQDVDVNATSMSSILANMTRLQQVTFANTNLTGALPKKWPSNITFLEVSGNDVQGNIPTSIAELLQLQSLDLSSCNLSGTIPAAFGNLSSLQSLKLGSNRLKGSIPASFRKLSALTYLDLSDNQLNGSVPVFLSSMPGLRYIDLQKNSFRGEIPFNDTFLMTLNTFKVSGNPQLCYNSSTVSAKFVSGLQPCDSTGLPAEGPSAFSPNGAPSPEPYVKPKSSHRGPKKIVLIVAIALACIVGIIVIAVLLSKCCKSKD